MQIANIIKDKEVACFCRAKFDRSSLQTQTKHLREKQRSNIEFARNDIQAFMASEKNWQIWVNNKMKEFHILEAQVAAVEESQKKIAVKAFQRAYIINKIFNNKK
jgi:hypothetical protein